MLFRSGLPRCLSLGLLAGLFRNAVAPRLALCAGLGLARLEAVAIRRLYRANRFPHSGISFIPQCEFRFATNNLYLKDGYWGADSQSSGLSQNRPCDCARGASSDSH